VITPATAGEPASVTMTRTQLNKRTKSVWFIVGGGAGEYRSENEQLDQSVVRPVAIPNPLAMRRSLKRALRLEYVWTSHLRLVKKSCFEQHSPPHRELSGEL
jgi:hypothetical protein